MKILVPIKHVASLDEGYEFIDDISVDPDYLDFSLNEWDEFSVEAAVQLRDAAGGGEVVAVTVDNGEFDEGLISTVARGADRAVRIWGDDLAHADPLVVARVLAVFVEREQPDLVLCGVQSSDGVHSSTGVALAGIATLPRVAVVAGITLDVDSRTLIVDRELEAGVVERVKVSLPALLTVQTGINEPAYVTFRALKNAEKQGVEEVSLTDLGIGDPITSGYQLRGLRPPPTDDGAQMLSSDPGEAAARIAEIVREKIGR
jgi:electron transfer flavoprotein beta subunit